jgi:hypothetical protein
MKRCLPLWVSSFILALACEVRAQTGSDADEIAEYWEDTLWDESEMGGASIDSLTALRYWAPATAASFKSSAVCPIPAEDLYSIYAVFTTSSGVDELWHVLVEGDSSSSYYGRMLDYCQIEIPGSVHIDHVDCTNDEYSTYVVFDRSTDAEHLWVQNARWARVSSSCFVSDLHTVPNCGTCFQGPPNYQDNSPFHTSIAYNDGVVAVAGTSYCSCGSGTNKDHAAAFSTRAV